MKSPKLAGRSPWYPYYAAFSADFVDEMLEAIGPITGPIVDPWNGSGTTTAAARRTGLSALGIDANPALVVVGKGRLLSPGVRDSLKPLAKDLIAHAKRRTLRITASRGTTSVIDEGREPDLLELWFSESTWPRLRALADAITDKLLVRSPAYTSAITNVGALSDIAAFYYIALFDVARALTRAKRTTNPTWIKTGGGGKKVDVDWAAISAAYLDAVDAYGARLLADPQLVQDITVALGRATQLPIDDGVAGAVLTSPPYCTRIDYVVATLPELAILGATSRDVRSLRDSMLGTTTVTGRNVEHKRSWGPEADRFLGAVRSHPSKASGSYYAKYFTQYFDHLAASIAEFDRVRQRAAPVIMVVQDSHYKELRLDLATVTKEMVTSITGLRIRDQVDFAVRSMAAMNPRSRAYRSTFAAVETVLVFRPA